MSDSDNSGQGPSSEGDAFGGGIGGPPSDFGGDFDSSGGAGTDSGGFDDGGGVVFGGGGIGGAGASPFTLEDNKALARRLAIASIAPRLAQFQEGINALTGLSNASPQGLTQRLAPQIEQARAALQQMFKQVSSRFGPQGGGQTQRQQASGVEAIGAQLTRLFAGLPEQARSALIQLIENFQIVPQTPVPISQVSSQPFNPQSVAGSIVGGAELGKIGVRAYQGFTGSPTIPSQIYPYTAPAGGDITQGGFGAYAI